MSSDSTSDDLRGSVERLVARLEAIQPRVFDLGTPDVGGSPEVEALAAIGSPAVSLLLQRLEGASAKVTAYIVNALALIGDPAALPELEELASRYGEISSKDMWEFAAAGQVDLALSGLRGSGGRGTSI